MLGLILLYVGAVLFINALTALGHIEPKEAAIMNLLTGGLSLFVSLHQVASGDPALVRAAAFGLLFSFTYLWVAYVHLSGLDGRGLGGSACLSPSRLQRSRWTALWVQKLRASIGWQPTGWLGRCFGCASS
jgi:hypothetical protein